MTDYRKQLILNATRNYNVFEEKQMNSDKAIIYANASDIHAYNILYAYIKAHEGFLDEAQVRFLVSKSDRVIDFLYENSNAFNLNTPEDFHLLIETERQKVPKDTYYREQLSANAEDEFQIFKGLTLLYSQEHIFDSAEEIYFYTQMREFFTGNHFLDEDTCAYLCGAGNNIIAILYKSYMHSMQSEPYSINTKADIEAFIEDYRYAGDETYAGDGAIRQKKEIEM